MIEWVPLGSGPRPVPRPVAAPLVWAGAFAGALALVALVNGTVGYGRPGLALALLSLLAALLGVCARFTAAPGTALLCGCPSTASRSRRPASSPGPAGGTRSGWPACSRPPWSVRHWPGWRTRGPPTAG